MELWLFHSIQMKLKLGRPLSSKCTRWRWQWFKMRQIGKPSPLKRTKLFKGVTLLLYPLEMFLSCFSYDK